ncbi:hypothetical protein LJR235_001270 [Pararhizobium sp. LjRoot235]|uniref:hypothetical protein n=1 Tax=Pararhizobium sp. LjRoot235 TaxID=3342291 RepID=UPI003ECC8169
MHWNWAASSAAIRVAQLEKDVTAFADKLRPGYKIEVGGSRRGKRQEPGADCGRRAADAVHHGDGGEVVPV